MDKNKKLQILKDEKLTRNFLKQHPEIIVASADKGNATVIVRKDEYITEMENMFADITKYKIITKDPTRVYENRSNEIIQTLISLKYVEPGTISTKYNSITPKAYGLRKTHKQSVSYRPVISNINAPSYNLAKMVHNILNPVCNSYNRNLKNSFEVLDKIKEFKLPKDYILISMDVVSLFPSIPQKLVLKIIDEEWNNILHYTKMPKYMFRSIVKFLFESSYFVFNGKTYLQLDGSAMGNPASPVLANLVIEYVFKHVINSLPFIAFFGLYYVDDSLFAIPKDKCSLILDKFNNFDRNIQFTMEVENDGKLPFLDILLIRRDDGSILTNWYSKPTSSGRILNFLSCHPTHMKINNVRNMLHRAISLSSTLFMEENILKIKTILKENNYPKAWYNGVIHKFLTTPNNEHKLKENDEKPKLFWRFPNIPHLSTRISSIFKDCKEQKMVLYNNKTTRSLFTKIKDKEDQKNTSNVVYKLNCKNCEKSYVGQTSQRIEKRVAQHKTTCKNEKHREKSALAQHHHDSGHDFDFENYKILDFESNSVKRRVSEMIHITMQFNNKVNQRSDTDNLSSSYKNLIRNYHSLRQL